MKRGHLFVFISEAMFFFSALILFQSRPSTAATSYDMWDWMCHDDWQNYYMTGSHDQRNKIKDSNTTLLHIKRESNGYPFELRQRIGGGIYMKYEGMDWTVLADELNVGYQDLEDFVIEKVNGERIALKDRSSNLFFFNQFEINHGF